MIELMNQAMERYDDAFFKIDKVEQTENDLSVTLSLYKDVRGITAGRYHQWLITCRGVQESSLNLQNTFFYVKQLQDHPVLFKYHKPFFMIEGPIQAYKNSSVYGKLLIELQTFAQNYGSSAFAAEFLPDLETYTDEWVYLTNGPQEILDIYTQVFETESMKVTASPYGCFYSDTGQEQILLFGPSHYVVAERFEVNLLEL
ncbi:hypothetical protein [Paenibacillus tengchongensis]|uniref:hypothetical protein n=1 Tax=Paenibacillus tengchongensis TaxID=2608684 RepID=UPI00124C10CD|nr:hypothetical protein [Paenibacillus tengchongensis]